MRLKSIWCLGFALTLTFSNFAANAQTICPKPKQDVVIYFGNGIDTTEKSARRSKDRLREELGDTYNGATLRYDLSYNQTEGFAQDLAQSVDQARIQWNSQVAGWLNQIGLLPDAWNEAYQTLMRASSAVTAPELKEHVQNYKSDILLGQKVLVVSHSQGNSYVNAAKIALEQELNTQQMRSFNVFGVAVPANNIAGGKEPYYTNHRDLIQYVPNSLAVNWTLRRSDGSAADDREIVAAHSFVDTYMSTDYDIRPSLVLGVKGQINKTIASTPVCDNYYKLLTRFFQGTYALVVNNSEKTPTLLAIQDDGTAVPPFLPARDYTSPPPFALTADHLTFGVGSFGFGAKRNFGLIDDSYTWDGAGKFIGSNNLNQPADNPAPGVFVPRAGASVDLTQPVYLKNKNLGKWMLTPVVGKIELMQCESAIDNIPVVGIGKKKTFAVVEFGADTVSVNGTSFDFSSDAAGATAFVRTDLRRGADGFSVADNPAAGASVQTLESTIMEFSYSFYSFGARSFNITSFAPNVADPRLLSCRKCNSFSVVQCN